MSERTFSVDYTATEALRSRMRYRHNMKTVACGGIIDQAALKKLRSDSAGSSTNSAGQVRVATNSVG